MTLSNLLCGAADLSAIVAASGERRIDLGQLRRDVACNADVLRARGCRRGLLVTRDTYWAAVGMLALFQAGAAVVMPPNALPETVSSLSGEWDCLVSDGEIAGIANQHVLVAGAGPSAPLRSLESETCVLELFTSGSTGEPKRILKTLDLMEREAEMIEGLIGPCLPVGSAIAGTVSHQHLYGLSFRLFWPLCSGRAFDPVVHEFWESLVHHSSGGAVIASPAHLTRIPGTFAASAGDRPRVIVSAGAPLRQAAAREAQRIFAAPIFEIYGSTETGVIAWRLRDNSDEAWRPIPGATVRQGADGRILLTSPLLAAGTRHEGADRIDLLPDGRFHLRERTDRIAKIEGKRVSLAEVERRLLDLPGVAAASVVVLPGEKPCLAAAAVATPEATRSLTEMGAFRFGRGLRKQLGAFLEPASLPRRWRFVPALPSGALGKVRAEDVIALFDEAKAAVPTDRPREPDILAVRQEADRVEIELFNRPDLLQLDGHFPRIAIVPGVAQIDWAVKLAARFLGLTVEAATSFQVKFHRLTVPDTRVVLRLEHDRARRRLSFAYRKPDEQVLTSGSIRVKGR